METKKNQCLQQHDEDGKLLFMLTNQNRSIRVTNNLTVSNQEFILKMFLCDFKSLLKSTQNGVRVNI